MVEVKWVRQTPVEGEVEATALVVAKDGDEIKASDLGLKYISYVKAVTPLVAGHVPGAPVVNNPDSVGNSFVVHLYSITANSDSVVPAGSIESVVVAVQR